MIEFLLDINLIQLCPAHFYRIIHETSSPKHPSSNPAEPQVKNAKRIAQKTGSVQEFQAQLAKFRNIPCQDRVAPSKLFFNRELRDPTLPNLIENKLLLSEEAAKRQISKLKNCKKADFRAELPKLDPGALVLLQDPESGLWDQSGKVVSLHDTKERSYWIKRHGKKQLIRRNRVLLRPIKNKTSLRNSNLSPSNLRGRSQTI